MMHISFKEVPDNYTLCVKADCPVADHCLRQLAMQVLTSRNKILKIVNPLLTQPSEQCEFYRSDEPQVFARGFSISDLMLTSSSTTGTTDQRWSLRLVRTACTRVFCRLYCGIPIEVPQYSASRTGSTANGLLLPY